MIRPRAIKQFLARPREDYRTWKKLSLLELQDMVERLPVRPPIWKKLKKHQRVCLLIGATTERFCFWNDTGTGKTLLSLSLMLYFRKAGVVKQNLVLVPNRINKYGWRRDVKKHSPNTKVCVLAGSSAQKWEQFEQTDAPLIVETYGGLVRMVTKRVPGKKKKKTQLKIDFDLVAKLLTKVGGIYMDESIHVMRKKRHGSLAHRICRRMAKLCKTAFALNGTPFGRDPTDAWGQHHIVDQGRTLGETLGLFRAAFFKEKKNFWGGFDYKFDRTKMKLLHRMMAGGSIRYTANQADLPRVIRYPVEVRLPADAQTYYDHAKAELRKARGNFTELKNSFLRMRQISSGFVGYHDDDLGARAQYEFNPNHKLEALLDYIESIHLEHKFVVFHEFTFSGSIICRELEKMGIGHARIYGKTKDGDAQLERLMSDDKCRGLVLQNASGGYGLDQLKVAKYGLYFESPVGPVLRRQTERRIERQYSEHDKVFLVDFIARGTVDQQILAFHREGRDLFQGIIEGDARP